MLVATQCSHKLHVNHKHGKFITLALLLGKNTPPSNWGRSSLKNRQVEYHAKSKIFS